MREYSTLTERIIRLTMPKVDSARLEKAVVDFKAFLQRISPDYYTQVNHLWSYSLKAADDGGPEIDKRIVKLEYEFWEKKPENNKNESIWRIKLSDEDVVFNYRKNKINDSGSWEDFIATAQTYIMTLQSFLKIEWKGLCVTYFFVYGEDTVEDRLIARNDWIEVRKILQPFASMPFDKSFRAFIPKYEWDQSWYCNTSDSDKYVLNCRLETNSTKGHPLKIYMYLSATVPTDILKKGLPWSNIHVLLRDNYSSLLFGETKDLFAGDFK